MTVERDIGSRAWVPETTCDASTEEVADAKSTASAREAVWDSLMVDCSADVLLLLLMLYWLEER